MTIILCKVTENVTYEGGQVAEYTGMMRTNLSMDERRKLRKIATSKGMTLVGYYDSVLRAEIRKAEKPNKEGHP